MKTKAVRLYGRGDLRLEEFELPPITDGEILVKIVSDSICMSSHKALEQGADHKRVPGDVAENPVIIGHEFCGEILEAGKRWRDKFSPGSRFAIQPAINDPLDVHSSPGYSFRHLGGDATYGIIPAAVMERGCLLNYEGGAFFHGSLAEPMSCVIGGFHASYHTRAGSYTHDMGTVAGGRMALLAGAGPMGLGAVDYALHSERRPSLLVVTDIDDKRLARAESIYSPREAEELGVRLVYVNASAAGDPVSFLRELSGGGGYDDVFVYAPVRSVVEQADAILAYGGCLNFFAGPTDPGFSAEINFYNVHYKATHVAGNSGGTVGDMEEALSMMASGKIDPSAMITHVGGLDSVIETTLNLPKMPGGKKLVYNHVSMPMTAIDDFAEMGASDPFFHRLAEITKKNNGLWCSGAERFLLENARRI